MPGRVVIALVVLLTVGTIGLNAHEIPNEVTVQTFLKPEGQRLMFLVRAPMKAMRDMDVPRRGGAIRLHRPGAHRPRAARRRDTVDCRLRQALRKRPAASLPGGRSRRASRCRPIDRSSRTTRRWRTSMVRRCRSRPTSSGKKACWMSRSRFPFSRTNRSSPSARV